ncbi:hypothetical protein ACFL3V_07155 [Nanoarchaeota archaeon]
MSINKIIAIALGLFVLYLLVVHGGGRIKEAIAGATPSCNSNVAKCACFYVDNGCPDAYSKVQYNSPSCPLDTELCTTDQKYVELRDAAVKLYKPKKDKSKLGTCCMAPVGKVSDTRLKGYSGSEHVAAPSPTTATAPALPGSPAIIIVRYSSQTSVNYQFDRNTNKWTYDGGFGKDSVDDMGSPYSAENREIASILSGKNEPDGYVFFRGLTASNLEKKEGVP